VKQGSVYRALARLAQHPLFYDKLKKENGIPVMVFEIMLRRNAQKRRGTVTSLGSKAASGGGREPQQGQAAEEEEDDFTDELVVRLRRDYASIRIQSCVRTYLARVRHAKTLKLLSDENIMNVYRKQSSVHFSDPTKKV
jgi:hypothetical protein